MVATGSLPTSLSIRQSFCGNEAGDPVTIKWDACVSSERHSRVAVVLQQADASLRTERLLRAANRLGNRFIGKDLGLRMQLLPLAKRRSCVGVILERQT